MRRLRSARSPDPDGASLEGFDRAGFEGDPVDPVGDEIRTLRPFGSDIPELFLTRSSGIEEPDTLRIPRQATELVALGRRLDAELLLRRHLDDSPRDAVVRTLLAELLDEGGNPDAALEELTRAHADATDPVPVLVLRGAALARAGRTAESEADLREALRLQAGYGPAHFHLGLTLLRRGLGADAIASLRDALRILPNHPDASYYLGEALQTQGDLSGALAALERAAVIAPGVPRTYKLMGRLLDRLGRTDEAMAMHKKAREASIR
jgi:tetratricopeptide (TPR) repeat protein